MELRQLEYLVAAAREGSLSAAAARMHVTPSALSKALGRLEGELGTRLLSRGWREVRLTSAGELFLPRAIAVVDALEAARTEMSDAGAQSRGRVDLVVDPAMEALGPVGSRWMSTFRKHYPHVSVRVRHGGSSGDLIAAVRGADADLALVVAAEEPVEPSLTIETVATGHLSAIAPPRHRIAARAQVTLQDLARNALVLGPPGSEIRSIVEAAARKHRVELDIQLEAPSIDMRRDLVLDEQALTVATDLAATTYRPAHATPFADPGLHYSICLVRRTATFTSKTVALLSTTLRDCIQDATRTANATNSSARGNGSRWAGRPAIPYPTRAPATQAA